MPDKSYRYVLPLKNLGEKNCRNLKNIHSEKKGRKVKITFLKVMNTFHNFALKIETSWVERVVKAYFGNQKWKWWPYACIYVCMVYAFFDKK